MKTNGAYKIEKSIPLPNPEGRGPQKSAHAIALCSLKVGDSVLLNLSRATVHNHCQRWIGAGKYAVRTMDGGFRVWRIK